MNVRVWLALIEAAVYMVVFVVALRILLSMRRFDKEHPPRD